jgi:hypothetical protein
LAEQSQPEEGMKMKSSIAEIPTIIGTFMGGAGYYAGRIHVDGQPFAIIVAPKSVGEIETVWNDTYKSVDGAKSFNDGLSNTLAMAEAGSKAAKWALGLDIEGVTGWYLPSLDEQEIIYRNLKPTTAENYCYMRSGINLSAITPTAPYTPEFPAQTMAELFKDGGAEAFDPRWYWTSTQDASGSDYAWCQLFGIGGQNYYGKGSKLRARAVRRLPI